MTSVSARYADAARHKYPNAAPGDIIVQDVGAGPELLFWNTAIGPQMTEADVTAEIALMDAEIARRSGVYADANRVNLRDRLDVATAAQLNAHVDAVVVSTTTVTALRDNCRVMFKEIIQELAAYRASNEMKD